MEAFLIVAIVILVGWYLIARSTTRSDRPAPAPTRRTPTLHEAVRRGDRAATAERLAQGSDVNAVDKVGDTVLHVAWFEGRDGLVGSLLDRGADPEQRNLSGLTPPRMRDLAPVVRLMRETADTLHPADTARDRLRATPADLYAGALWRLVAFDPARHRVLILAVKLGVPGSEAVLSELLDHFGDRTTAEILLNCGSTVLSAAAEKWATRHGYHLIRTYGGHLATWGEG